MSYMESERLVEYMVDTRDIEDSGKSRKPQCKLIETELPLSAPDASTNHPCDKLDQPPLEPGK